MKYVLITGAGGGMGYEAVKCLKKAGYHVFALDINPPKAEQDVTPVKADLTCESDVTAAFETVSTVTNSLYAIIHFAGIYTLDSLVEMSEEKYVKAFDVNVFGAYRVNKAFLPLLNAGSRIIITTSELAPLYPLPFTGVYAITKSALDKYAYSLRMELQLLGITVCVLRPGAVKTDMLGVSTTALDRFCQSTKIYTCNAERFRAVVDKVEARNVTPAVIANKVERILKARRPRYVYSLNRNPLLLLLNALPPRMQTAIICMILKDKNK